MVAAFVGMLTIVLAAWLWKREPRRWVKRLGAAALATVVAQGVLGGITVLFFLPTAISVSHACLAQIFFCLTVTLALVTGERWKQPASPALDQGAPPLGQLAIFTVAAIFLQLAMGAALRHKGFGITPHLGGAGVVTFMVLWTLYRVISQHAGQPAVMRPAGTLAALLVAQLALGAASYYVRWVTRDAPQPLPEMVWVTVAHVATGALTLAASVWLALEARRGLIPAERGRERAAIAA
jgi:cytochrome c oxidase assembly protein subunit 15